MLREVERALEKVQDETYGLCEGTEEPIGYARLKLRPWTRYSVTYKEEFEREEKRSGQRIVISLHNLRGCLKIGSF